MPERYNIVRDSHRRLVAEVAPGVFVGIKTLPEDHPRRIAERCHAYVVIDIDTPLGSLRWREVRIVWSTRNQQFFVRYKQFMIGQRDTPKERWLDVVGPHKGDTRKAFEKAILDLYEQILDDSESGDLPLTPEDTRYQKKGEEASSSALADGPGGEALAALQEKLVKAESEAGTEPEGEQEETAPATA